MTRYPRQLWKHATPEERERELMARLPQLVARAQQAPGWARILDGVDAADITSRAALAQLPVTRKSDLKALQHAARCRSAA